MKFKTAVDADTGKLAERSDRRVTVEPKAQKPETDEYQLCYAILGQRKIVCTQCVTTSDLRNYLG